MYNKDWYLKYKSTIIKATVDYNRQNPEKVKQIKARYYQNNRQWIISREKQRRYAQSGILYIKKLFV